MRKVVALPFISLDGFMSGPQGEIEWNMPYFDEEMGGVPLFKQAVKLKLLETRPLRSGVVILRYQTLK